MDRRRLLFYLLLNVFVSACVTGAVLFWYDRNYRSASLSALPPPSSANTQSNLPVSTLDPQTDVPVEIVSIVGAGTLNAEWVVVAYKGEDQINLANWTIKDEDGQVFVFPQLVLHKDGAVQLHTISGTNTVIDLYWGASQPIWQSGEAAQLIDPSGNVRAIYKVP